MRFLASRPAGIGVVAVLGFAAPAAEAESPVPTCDWPYPSFGWKLAAEGVADAYLRDVPIDGLVRLPVDHSIGLVGATGAEPLEAVELTVTGPDGPIEGETSMSDRRTYGGRAVDDGQPHHLDWRAFEPLAPSTRYTLAIRFDNPILSSCDAAVLVEETLSFETGDELARDGLRAGEVAAIALSELRHGSNGGCCGTHVGEPCEAHGLCTQCWKTSVRTEANVAWETPLASPYYEHVIVPEAPSARLYRGPATNLVGEGSTLVWLQVRAASYCFRLETKAVADGETTRSDPVCIDDGDRQEVAEATHTERVLSSTCTEAPDHAPPPEHTNIWLDVAYGVDVADAYAALDEGRPDPGREQPGGDGCASGGEPGFGAGLAVLAFLLVRRRPPLAPRRRAA